MQKLITRLTDLNPTPLLVFLAVSGIFWFTAPANQLGTDGATRDAIARNIVNEGTIVFLQAERGEIAADIWAHEGVGGRLYSIYGIGQSLLEVPFVFIAKLGRETGLLEFLINTHLFPQLSLMTFSGALIAVLAYMSMVSLGYSRQTGLKTALLISFAGPLWVLTRQTYDIVQETLAILGAVTFILMASQKQQKQARWLVFAGLMWGMAMSIRISAAIAAPGLAALIIFTGAWNTWRKRITAGLWLGLGFALLAWIPFAYNLARFGSLFEFGYTGHAPYFGAPVIPTAFQWIAGPWRGMLVYMPVLLLLPLAWRYFRRDHGIALPLSGVMLTASYILFYSQFTDLGIMGWGPYYILPAVIPLSLLVGALFEHRRQLLRWQAGLLSVLVVLGVLVQAAGFSVPMERYLVTSGLAGLGFDEDNIGELDRSPIINQAAGTVVVWRNLPDYQKYIAPLENAPAERDWQYLSDTYFGFNLPDWWWLIRVLRGGVSGYAMPLITLAALAWISTQLARATPADSPPC